MNVSIHLGRKEFICRQILFQDREFVPRYPFDKVVAWNFQPNLRQRTAAMVEADALHRFLVCIAAFTLQTIGGNLNSWRAGGN